MSSIFGNAKKQNAPTSVVMESLLASIQVGYIDDSSAGLQEILHESTADMYRLEASYFISDIIMTEQVLTEGAQPEILMENFVKTAWEKLKAIFVKMWATVRGWYEKAKESLKLIFMSGAKFVKEFKNKITEKSTDKFTHEGFKYTIAKGEATVNTKRKVITDFLGTVGFNLSEAQKDSSSANKPGDHDGEYGQEEIIRGGGHTATSYKEDEVKTKLRKDLGNEDFSEVLKTIRKDFRDGKDEKHEIKSFADNGKDEMMTFITENAENVKSVSDAQKDMDSDFKRVLSAIETAKNAIHSAPGTDANRAALTTFATHKFKVAQYALTLQQGISGTHIQSLREAAKDFEGALKSFLRFKAAKEGFVGFDDDTDAPDETDTDDNIENESILESALKYV